MKLRYFLLVLAFLGSCSSNDRVSSGHRHHVTECDEAGCKTREKSCAEKNCPIELAKYEGQCALSVSHGDTGVKGKNEHKLLHEGRIYYFSSEKSMHVFQENIDENVSRADQNWDVFKWRQWR